MSLDYRAETWTDALLEYTKWQTAAGFSKGTRKVRRVYLQRLANQYRPRGPWQLTEADLVDALAVPEWAAETRHSARSHVRSFYSWAFATRRVKVDPSERLPRVKVPRAVPRPVPEEVFFAALDAAAPRERAMLVLGGYAGLRRAEIARVHRRDITSDGLRVLGKGGVVRLVPLHPRVVEALAWLPAKGYVFPGKIDGHLSPDHVGQLTTVALGGAYTTHTLRHRFGTQAYSGTHDLRAVQELLGHSKPETTARYTAVASEGLREAVRKIA